MVKRTKRNIIIGIILISILVFVLAQTDILPFVTVPFCPGETGTITSISRVDFDSIHPLFQGPAWITEFRALPLGQCLFGSFSASEISDDDTKATYGFGIDIISDTQSCNYNIERTKDIWRLVERKRFFEKETDANAYFNEEWKAVNFDQTLKPKLFETGTFLDWEGWVYSFRQTFQDSVGELKNPSIDWGVTFIFDDKKNNRQYSEKITSETARSVWLEEGKVRASWSGNLLGERWCPSETNAGAFQIAGGSWILTSPNLENQFNNVISTWRSCMNAANTPIAGSDCNRGFNEDYSILDDEKSFCSSQVGECANVLGNKAIIESNQPLLIPSFQLFIKADILGIFQAVGEPKITNIDVEDLVSDKQARVDVTGKNIGDDIGSFDMWVECPSPFNVITPTNTFSLSPDKERTIPFTISGSSIDDVSKTCCAFIKERATGEQDKECFTMNMIGSGTRCSPVGKQICIHNQINTCGEDGKYSVTKDCGDLKCEERATGAVCVPKGNQTCIDCWNWAGNFFVKEEDECVPATIYEFKLGHLISWDKGPVIFSISQKTFCPIMIIGISVIVVLIILIISVLIKQKRIQKLFK